MGTNVDNGLVNCASSTCTGNVKLDAYKSRRRDVIGKGSRSAWREMCGRYVSVALSGASTSDAVQLFELIDDVVLDTDGESISRESMSDFMDIFTYLTKCAESPEPEVRRRAQVLFDRLLSNFQPVAQNLLLCHIFELVADRKLETKMEPQILAWLVDNYRKRLNDPSEECSAVFRGELSHFYGQIRPVTYDDMVTANPFFVSVLLLVREHATRRFSPALLREVRSTICGKIENQLVDYLRMKELQAQSRQEEKEPPVHQDGPDCHVPEPLFVLDLIKFRLSDVNAAIAKALGSDK